ncbi:hypothetical protein LCGC14_0145960 [marine sediment metagenome]|uniref:Uncharacterized protein n=1 Tax=marine sediment metagenome TaxID=412755 RepID=A0A0F9UZV3_9ZZZZ
MDNDKWCTCPLKLGFICPSCNNKPWKRNSPMSEEKEKKPRVVRVEAWAATSEMWSIIGIAIFILACAHSCVYCFGPLGTEAEDNAKALRETCAEIQDPMQRAECLKPLFRENR